MITLIKTLAMLELNLQAFAYDPQAQPVNWTGSPELSAEIKTFYDMTLIDDASPLLIHDQWAQKKPIPKGKGKTIEFRKYAALEKALKPLTEGVTPDGSKLTVSAIFATVEQYGDFVPITDVLDLTAIDNNLVEAQKVLSRQAGLTLDTITRNVLQSGTNVSYASKKSGSTVTEVNSRYHLDNTAKCTVDTFERVGAELRAQNAPEIDGYYIAIVHPYVAYDIRRDPEFIEAHKYAKPEELYNGEIGQIAGFRVMQTSEAKIFKGEDLSEESRNLTVVSVDGQNITVNETITSAILGRYILINGTRYEVTEAQVGQKKIKVKETISDVSADDVVYPGEGGAEGIAVFGCLFFGANAYGTTEIEGGGLEMIIQQLGSGGTSDPLKQRATAGWKATKTAEILVQNFLKRVECGSSYSSTELKAN